MPSRSPWAQISTRLTPIAVQHRRDHDRAGQRDVGPVGLQPRQPAALARRQLGHGLDQLLQALPGELVPVQLVERVAHPALVHAREGPDRAPDAHRPAAGGVQPGQVAKLLGHVLAQGLDVGAARPLPAEESLGHADGPEGARHGPLEPPADHLGHLHAPAAQVEHVAVAEGGAVDGAEVPVPGLLLGREGAHVQRPVGREGGHQPRRALAASRAALVATASTASTPLAATKAA